MYLVWYDDSPKKSVQEKIDEAIDRFQDRFGFAPDQCLVSTGLDIQHPHLTVRPVHYVRPHYFQVGCEDDVMAALAQLGDQAGAHSSQPACYENSHLGPPIDADRMRIQRAV